MTTSNGLVHACPFCAGPSRRQLQMAENKRRWLCKAQPCRKSFITIDDVWVPGWHQRRINGVTVCARSPKVRASRRATPEERARRMAAQQLKREVARKIKDELRAPSMALTAARMRHRDRVELAGILSLADTGY